MPFIQSHLYSHSFAQLRMYQIAQQKNHVTIINIYYAQFIYLFMLFIIVYIQLPGNYFNIPFSYHFCTILSTIYPFCLSISLADICPPQPNKRTFFLAFFMIFHFTLLCAFCFQQNIQIPEYHFHPCQLCFSTVTYIKKPDLQKQLSLKKHCFPFSRFLKREL